MRSKKMTALRNKIYVLYNQYYGQIVPPMFSYRKGLFREYVSRLYLFDKPMNKNNFMFY